MTGLRRRLLAAALAAPFAPLCSALADEADVENGIFLVAKPDLLDPNFRETVVLITQVDATSGPMGVVINRPLAVRLQDAYPEPGIIPTQSSQIFGGGPVAQNRMLFLVRGSIAPERSLQIVDDVYMTGDPQLPVKVARGELKVRSEEHTSELQSH